MPTPEDPPKGGVTKSFATAITIRSAPEKVWAVLTDVSKWTQWNTTIDSAEGTIALGNTVTLHAKISPGRTFRLKVSALVPNEKMVWSDGMPLGLFKGVRTYTLTRVEGVQGAMPPLNDAHTEFAMREDFSGLFAPLIVRSIPNLKPAFDEFAACLKKHVEAM